MTHTPALTRLPGPATMVALAAASFAVITVLSLSVTLPGLGSAVLYAVPVALFAIAFGVRAGLVRKSAEEKFRALLESAPGAMVIVDEGGEIVQINAQTEELFGYEREELLGRDVEALIPPRFRAEHIVHRDGLFELPVERPMGADLELYGLHKNGNEFPVEISLGPLPTDEGTLVSAAIRDRRKSKRGQEHVARLAAIVESSEDAIIGQALDGTILSWNPAAKRLFGYRAEEAIGRNVSLVVPPDRTDELRRILERITLGKRVQHFDTKRLTRDRRELEVSLTVSPIRDIRGSIVGASASYRDITERRRAEDALREAEERFRQAFEEAPIGMALIELDGRFTRVNSALCEIAGYSREQLEDTSSEAITHPDDRSGEEHEIARVLAGEAAGFSVEKRYIRANGTPVWVALQATLLRAADGAPLRFLGQIQDITERRRYEERLRHMADHDPLTGLLNRRSFERELKAHGALTARYGGDGAAIVLDVDHFKYVNDTLGHAAGDEAIIRAGNALRSRLRETDVLARLGGDEFAVLLPRADAGAARLVAEELLEALRRETVELGGRARPLSASAGIAVFDGSPDLAAEEVLVNADLAMYDAKDAGRDRAQVYRGDEHQQSRMKGGMTLAERIGRALEGDGFTLLEQPIIDLTSGLPSQHELLLRMRDERGDLIPPGAFLYIAERIGLVQDIDRWVTRRAIRLLAERRKSGDERALEVNLSGLSIGDPALLALVRQELEYTRVSPASLVFEVTETAAVTNMTRAGRFARDLTRLGCRFALDDFGAGYGSFHYLKHLPFDFLKIDGGFVKDCRTSETDRLLVKAAVDIASGLGKRTIAEFVGDEETVQLLTWLGVDYGQGFHLGMPAPLATTQRITADRDAAGHGN